MKDYTNKKECLPHLKSRFFFNPEQIVACKLGVILMKRNLVKIQKILYKAFWTIINFRLKNFEVSLHEKTDDSKTSLELIAKTNKTTFIEPKWGFLFDSKGHLLEKAARSLNYPRIKSPWTYAISSPLEFIRVRKLAKNLNSIYFPKVISLRYFWEWNYYHFYLDVLGSLSLIDSKLNDTSIPIILGDYANEVPFVTQIIKKGKFKDRKWIIPGKKYVKADEVIFCTSNQTHKEKIDFLLANLEIPEANKNFNNRIFLNRGPKNTRHIINMDEVERVLNEFDFEIIDTVDMSLDEQIDIFSKAGYLIGIHGAGMTNLIFRGASELKVLELCSKGKKPTDWTRSNDFKIACEELGYYWDELRGEPDNNIPIRANFIIDPDELRGKIKKMLNTD